MSLPGQKYFRIPARILGLGFWLGFVLGRTAVNDEPRISLIERFGPTQVTIHFETGANRTYALQYATNIACAQSSANCWRNLFVAPRLPFENHYIVADDATDGERVYRLSVTR